MNSLGMEPSPTASTETTVPPPQPPHVVIFPSPGIGHIIPLIEFAKRLLPRFSFTLAIPSAAAPSSGLLSDLPIGIDSVFLPPIHISDSDNPMLVTVPRSLPSLRQLIVVDRRRVVALVVDLFGTDAIDVAVDLGVKPYIFYPSTAMALSLFLQLERLDQTVSCAYQEMKEPVRIPGCVPIQGRDLIDVFEDRSSHAYKWILGHCMRYKLAEGIIVNSFEGVEGGAIEALLKPEPGKPPVYPVGPLVRTNGAGGRDDECIKWLDRQPRGSVVLVNFGSGGTLSKEQTTELARGLALSQQRFLWVARAPNNAVPNAAYFGEDGGVDPLEGMPEGFVEETAGRGLVVPKWAPQMEVLGHVSTGGFLTHCGWNSVLESVVHGVPMIAWPLYAEQKMNAVMVSEDLRVGMRPQVGPDGVVRAQEVARVVREVVEGEEMRSRMEGLKKAAAAAMSVDHGSSSTKALTQIANIWDPKCTGP